jgi:hypothetical protein
MLGLDGHEFAAYFPIRHHLGVDLDYFGLGSNGVSANDIGVYLTHGLGNGFIACHRHYAGAVCAQGITPFHPSSS